MPSGLLSERGISVDRTGDVPVGVQIVWAFRAAIADGRLPRGERLPSMREIATELDVNPNTVATTMGELERAGYVEARQGSGTYVAATAPRHDALAPLIADVAAAARAQGLDQRVVAAALYGTHREAAGDGERFERSRLRGDIAVLDRLLGERLRHHADLAERLPDAPTRAPGPRVLTLDELDAERAHLLACLAVAAAAPVAEPSAEETAPARRAAPSRSARSSAPRAAPA